MIYNKLIPGAFELYVGAMYSGKTDGLIHRIDDVEFLDGVEYLLFKPAIDDRDPVIVSAFSKKEYHPIIVDQDQPETLLSHIKPSTNFVGIDEIQFFKPSITYVVESLQRRNINVVAAGLNTDFRGEPFGCMPDLMSVATHVTVSSGVCQFKHCNNPGTRTQRLVNGIPSSYYDSIVIIEDGSRKITNHH